VRAARWQCSSPRAQLVLVWSLPQQHHEELTSAKTLHRYVPPYLTCSGKEPVPSMRIRGRSTAGPGRLCHGMS
jgi:hypothetical protein